MKNLEIGDVIYGCYAGNVDSKTEIVRVTKTKAVDDQSNEFKRSYSENSPFSNTPIDTWSPQSRWSRRSYCLENESLKMEFEKHELLRKVKAFSFSTLEIEQLKKIVKIIEQ